MTNGRHQARYMMVEAFAQIDKEEIDPILSINHKSRLIMTSGHPGNYTSLTDADPHGGRGESCAASAASPSPCRRDQHWLIVVEGQAGRGRPSVVADGVWPQDAVLAGGVAVHGVDEFAISLRRGASPRRMSAVMAKMNTGGMTSHSALIQVRQ